MAIALRKPRPIDVGYEVKQRLGIPPRHSRTVQSFLRESKQHLTLDEYIKASVDGGSF
jgi:hypothetical protein